MTEEQSYRGLAGSGMLHGALLALILLGFASAPKFEDSQESIPVETISLAELNQIMNGAKDAKPAPRPPPAPPKPPEAPPDLRTAEEPTPPRPAKPEPAPPPKPEPPPPPPNSAAQDAPEPPERPKVVETPAERPKEPAPEKTKPDLLAKLVEREKAEPQPKPKPRPFDPNAIAKAIGENRPPEPSSAPTQVSSTPQGLPRHDAQRMSVSIASALDAWLTESYLNCWTPPPTMPEGDTYVAQIKVTFKADGSLSARPVLLNPPTDPAWRAHAESAMRAVRKCDPLHVPAQYAPYFEEWKVETIHFDPRETQG